MQKNKSESTLETNNDINKVFEDLLLIEEKIIEEGYQKGFQQGVKGNNAEGFHLGYHRGAELGAEIGYIAGVVEFYTEYFKKQPPSERISKTFNNLKKLIDTFPSWNHPDLDIITLAEEVQTEFKKFCSQQKIDLRLQKETLNF